MAEKTKKGGAKKPASKKKATAKKKPVAKKKSVPKKTGGPKKKPAQSKNKKKVVNFLIGLACLLTFGAGVVLMFHYGDRIFPPDGATKADVDKKKEAKKSTPKPRATKRTLDIYFGGIDGKSLYKERLTITGGTLEANVAAVVKALIDGPTVGEGTVIPDGTSLKSVEIKGRTAILDFSGELKYAHWGGSSAELQTLYAIVNSITLNFETLESVQILIDGEKAETLAGHIFINEPVGPDSSIIR